MLRSILAIFRTAALPAAVLVLASAAFSAPASAQYQYLRRDEAGNLFDPSLKNVSAYTVERRLTHPDCPGANYWLRYSVPAGTGNAAFDKILAADMEGDALMAEEAFLESFNEGACPEGFSDNGDFDERVFEIHSPGGGFLSILFITSSYTNGEPHGDVAYDVINIDPVSGRLMTLETVFRESPGAAAGVEALWPLMAERWCDSNWRQSLPNFYDLGGDRNWCANPAGSPLPPRLRREPSIDSLGVTFLTRNGMSILLGPYSAWDYVDGTVMIEFDKEELVKIGFDPGLWSWDDGGVFR